MSAGILLAASCEIGILCDCGTPNVCCDHYMQPEQAAPGGIDLDFKQATEFLAMFGGEPSEITLTQGDGHSGKGIYAHYTEYPEEGAEFLGVSDSEATPQQPAQPDPLKELTELSEELGLNDADFPLAAQPEGVRMLTPDEVAEIAEAYPSSDTGLVFESIEAFCNANNLTVMPS
jgi:hypothetical protein